jgi:MoxR-like ATPase
MSNINVTATTSFLSALAARSTSVHSGHAAVTRQDAALTAEALGLAFPRWFANGDTFRVSRGQFRVPSITECQGLGLGYGEPGKRGRKPGTVVVRQSKPRVSQASAMAFAQPAKVDVASLVTDDKANTDIQTAVSKALGVDVLLGSSDNIPYVPQVAKTYVPWGHFTDLKTLIESQHFLPTMIVGPSGNGKTDMCEQVCANLGREYVRVNITSQTDEDDLLGGFRLVNGETKFALGPIPLAMLRGAVVNLDEIDLGGSALMCLQPVLEGKPLYLKKIGRYINPAPGFNVVATANTKGRGDDGKYAHTTIMNEAMLERFAVMLEQGWADAATERKIVGNVLKQFGKFDATLVKHMVEFAAVTRNNFEQQICNDQIATRRLLHMARVFCALGSIESALQHTLSRFDADTANGFKNLWNAIHENPNATTSPSGAEAVAVEPTTEQAPF